MYEDPFFAVAARRGALLAEADRYRLVALARCCRETLRRRLTARLRPAAC